MRKAVLVSCFNYYDDRIKHIENYLIENNYDVMYIYSDFNHIKKSKQENISSNKNHTKINVPTYTKNISLNRIYSHYVFSKKVYGKLNEIDPDLIYCIVPPNFLSYFMSKFKKRENKTKLIFDIYDLWPETFPISKFKKIINIILKPWGLLRDLNIKSADLIITECNYYQELLNLDNKKQTNIETLYLMKSESADNTNKAIIKQKDNLLKIAYLGSINNIVDINKILLILKEINSKRPVELHLIGSGESKERLLKSLEINSINLIDYGNVYNFSDKQKILSQCDFGLNIMKESVAVGLTMKSIEYFQFGLPIINNIKGDTTNFVNKAKVGINVSDENIHEIAMEIAKMNLNEIQNYSVNAKKLFLTTFSEKAFYDNLERIFLRHIWNNRKKRKL